MTHRRIAVLGSGGTIAMEGAHPYDWVDYGDTGIIHTMDEVLKRVDPGLSDLDLIPISLRALPSTGVTPSDWLLIAKTIDELLSSDTLIDGVVVSHGTATLEETAFFLNLVHRHQQPIVLVGAQRPPNTASSDAAANLRAAIVCAASPRLRGGGAFIAMNSVVHFAYEATKTSNFDLDAFQSPEFGPIGRVEADGSLFLARAGRQPISGVFSGLHFSAELPRVDIVYSYAGADGAAVDAFVAAGARGLISTGFPPGRCTPGEREALKRARGKGVAVVQSSRAIRGRVPEQDYNGIDGILGGGGLSAGKARILLMLGLSLQLPPDQLQVLFLTDQGARLD